MRKWIAVLACLAALGLVNASIYQKEKLLAEGKLVFLELAPVDPRSLMQGDYMALRFAIANEIQRDMPISMTEHEHRLSNRDGHVIARLDTQSVAHFERLDDEQPLKPQEIKLLYRVRNDEVKFATNAFFFQEGRAQVYENARYGAFRVDDEGTMLLVGLRDEHLKPLGLETESR